MSQINFEPTSEGPGILTKEQKEKQRQEADGYFVLHDGRILPQLLKEVRSKEGIKVINKMSDPST